MQNNSEHVYDGLDLRRPLPVGTTVVIRTLELGREAGEASEGKVLSTVHIGFGELGYCVELYTGAITKVSANQVIFP
jgi:hypothetical protein